MDLELTDDQALLVDTATRFIDDEMPLTRVRALIDDEAGYDRAWLERAAGLGWFAGLIPEELGGGSVSGEGLLDAAMVAELHGRHLLPGPFLPNNVVADAVSRLGTKEQQADLLPALAAGEAVATWAVADGMGGWDGSGVTATRTTGGFRLDGAKSFVQDAVTADWFLVTAQGPAGPTQFLLQTETAGVEVRPLQCFDLARRMAEVRFAGVEVPASGRLGDEDEAGAAIARQLAVALVLQCAETVGVMDAMFAMTVQYSKDRIAFGRPIGSFQALKHVMADLAVYVETAKAGAVAAARAVQREADDADEVVSMVKAYIGDVAVEVAQESLQIHGGIGYTWEHDLHLLMRRASSNAVLYGGPAWHRERIFTIHGI